MRFGFIHLPLEPRRSITMIQEAERLAFDTAWVPDQNFHPDAFALLGAAALQTERVRLGLGVTNPFTMHPVITARGAGTVQELSNGRFVLGYGTGNRREYLTPLGHEFTRAPERCGEGIRIMRALLAGEEVRHRSELFVADGVKLKFLARPTPLYVSGIGPRILRVAGAVADGVIINFATPRALEWALGEVRAGAVDARRMLDGLPVVAWVICLVTPDKQVAYDGIRPFIAHTAAPTNESVLRAVGVPADVIAPLKRAYQEEGPKVASRYVSNAMCDIWAVIGEPDEVAERVRQLGESHVTEVALLPWARDVGEVLETARRFSADVMPKARECATSGRVTSRDPT
jgi:5,10-methylenetetrahydromethanopterin reductase